jgi:hypothetical protein
MKKTTVTMLIALLGAIAATVAVVGATPQQAYAQSGAAACGFDADDGEGGCSTATGAVAGASGGGAAFCPDFAAFDGACAEAAP